MSEVVREFTSAVPVWRPRLGPVALEAATEEQREALKVTPSDTKVSDYVLTLAHDPESLAARTPLFNAIMYGRGGLPRADRELGALAASVFNRCVYCAAVHAERHIQLSKDDATVTAVFRDGEAAALHPREAAILAYASALSRSPAEADAEAVAALREAGLSELEILDLTLATALFAWANRLMHTLGDPVRASGG